MLWPLPPTPPLRIRSQGKSKRALGQLSPATAQLHWPIKLQCSSTVTSVPVRQRLRYPFNPPKTPQTPPGFLGFPNLPKPTVIYKSPLTKVLLLPHTYLAGDTAIKKAVILPGTPALHSAEWNEHESPSGASPAQFLVSSGLFIGRLA